MSISAWLILGAVWAGTPHDEETKRSIAVIEKLQGKVAFDKTPGMPVVSVNL